MRKHPPVLVGGVLVLRILSTSRVDMCKSYAWLSVGNTVLLESPVGCLRFLTSKDLTGKGMQRNSNNHLMFNDQLS